MTERMTMKEWAHGWAICVFGLLMVTASPALAETPAAILNYDATDVTTLTTGRVTTAALPAGAMECWAITDTADDTAWHEPRCPRPVAPTLSLAGPGFARLTIATGQ